MAFFSLKGISSSSNSSSVPRTLYVSVGKVVNPLGTVTTITESPQESIIAANEFSEEYMSGAYIHENCDESMFRPYVAVISGVIDDGSGGAGGGGGGAGGDDCIEMPEPIGQKLIVPVIDGTQLIRQNEEKVRLESVAAEKMMQIDQLASSNCAMPPPPQPQAQQLSKKERKKSAKEKNETTVEAVDIANVPGGTESVNRTVDTKRGDTKTRKSSPDVEKKVDETIKPYDGTIDKQVQSRTDDIAVESATTGDIANVKSMDAKGADGDVVTVKSKKKTGKISAKFSEPILPAEEVKSRKNSKDNGSKRELEIAKKIDDEIEAEIMVLGTIQAIVGAEEVSLDRKPQKKLSKKSDSGGVEEKRTELEMGKPTPAERSSLRESKSNESSVEKESLPSEDTTKMKKNRKQRRAEKAAAEAVESTLPVADVEPIVAETELEPTEFTFNLKGKRVSTPSRETGDDFAMIEEFEKAHDDDCSKIQDSLLRNPVVTATVSLRKNSAHEKYDFVDADETKATKSGAKKKKSSKDSMDVTDLVLTIPDDPSDFTFADVLEPTPELDSLSFKSTSEDPMSLINFESPLQETSDSVSLNDRTTDYDKLSDDVEIGADSDAQFSDCKPFQLVIDETELYIKTSDSNSSDDNEESSQDKYGKCEKTLTDEHDEELQPLIDSATSMSENAVDLQPDQLLMKTNDDAVDQPLPEGLHPGDSQKAQPQQTANTNSNNNNGNNNSNNKKKFRKKRR